MDRFLVKKSGDDSNPKKRSAENGDGDGSGDAKKQATGAAAAAAASPRPIFVIGPGASGGDCKELAELLGRLGTV